MDYRESIIMIKFGTPKIRTVGKAKYPEKDEVGSSYELIARDRIRKR